MRFILPLLGILALSLEPTSALSLDIEGKHDRIALVKAAMIRRVLHYIDYDGKKLSVQTPMVCFYKSENIFRAVQEMGKSSRDLEVVQLTKNNFYKNKCNVIYLDAKLASKDAMQLLSMQNNLPLIIGNNSTQLTDFEMVSFVETGGKISIYIDLSNLRKAALKANPDLLDVAGKVRE